MTRRFLTFLLDILPGLILLAALALALLLLLPTPRGEPQTDLGSSGGAAVLPGAPEKVPASLATAGRVAVSMGDSDGSGAPPPQAAKGGSAAPRAGLAIGTSSPAGYSDSGSCTTPCFVRVPPDPWHRAVATSFGIHDGYLGRGMACGGKLTWTALVVAHRTLPCNTRVTFRFRGHVVTAVVRDRGPYVAGRTWDLGPAVARALHFNGLDWVEWRLE